MPVISVEVSAELYAELTRRKLPVSQIAQRAFAAAVAGDAAGDNRDWVTRARRRPVRASAISTEDLTRAVDEEFGE